jgi:hypothetical protein
MTTKTAVLVRKLTDFRGDARLFRVDPPMPEVETDWDTGTGRVIYHEYVVVSAVVAMFSGPETYIFPATPDGEVVNFLELDGSYRGGLNHETALNNAGYAVVATDSEATMTATVGALARNRFKALCDTLGVTYTEHKGLTESSFALRGTLENVTKVKAAMEADQPRSTVPEGSHGSDWSGAHVTDGEWTGRQV